MNTDDPDGMALACKVCGFRPAGEVTMGVFAAHVETEHDTTELLLDLVVICDRCDVVMPHRRSEGNRHWHDCPQCRRTRVLKTREPLS